MRRGFMSRRFAVLAASLLLGSALIAAGAADAATPNRSPRAHLPSRFVCASPGRHAAACQARVITDSVGAQLAAAAPVGYGPTQFRTAYSLPSAAAGAGQTIGIVDGF